MKSKTPSFSLIRMVFCVLAAWMFNSSSLVAQCNTNTSICTSGTAGPFNFVPSSGNVSTCLDFWNGYNAPNYAYIVLYITQGGPLRMLIDANTNGGYLDVAVFNIPAGQSPCTAIQSNSNQIACNYADDDGGCNQFGNYFPCSSNVPAPNVQAGQRIMIVVEDWSDEQTSITLQLAPTGAQTGAPSAGIPNGAGPFCLSSPPTQLVATNQGGTWSGPGVSASGMFNPATAGVGTHTITYSIGVAPCNSTSTTQVTVNSAGTLNVSPNTSVCAGGSAVLTASGASSYTWSPATGLSSTNQATVTASPTSTTTYTVTGTSTGCNATGTVTVSIGANPAVTASSNGPICEGESLQLSAVTQVPGATYSWTGPNGFTSTQQNPVVANITQANAGTYTVQIAVNGCSNTASTNLVINPNIYPVLTPAGPFCQSNPPFQLTTNIPGGTWSGPGVDPATGMFDPSQATVGTNTVSYTTSGPCGGMSEIEIVVTANPEVDFIVSSSSGCSPFTVTFTDLSTPPSQSAVWNFGSATNSFQSNTHTFVNVGCYDISLTSTSNGCTATKTIAGAVCVQPDPIAEFVVPDYTNSIFYPTFSFTNQSSNASSYVWYFGDGSTSFVPNPTHTYGEIARAYDVVLVAISPAGCTDTVQNTVYVEEELVFFIPNAFTPDGDEYNNTFSPVFTSGFDPLNYSMVIYNRWGEALFESKNAEVGWDGFYAGAKCQEGVYTWAIRFKDSRSDKKYNYKGHMTILR